MERAHKNRKLSTTDIVYCGLFTALIAVGAFIKIMIPIGVFEVTFSLQFFFAASRMKHMRKLPKKSPL